jgi:uncharacterized protein (TIGR00255 family)
MTLTSLTSMTGFGRSDGSSGASVWTWEIRTVNGRGLDVRLRLPPGAEALEAKVREAIGRKLNRGSVNVALTLISCARWKFCVRASADQRRRLNR